MSVHGYGNILAVLVMLASGALAGVALGIAIVTAIAGWPWRPWCIGGGALALVAFAAWTQL